MHGQIRLHRTVLTRRRRCSQAAASLGAHTHHPKALVHQPLKLLLSHPFHFLFSHKHLEVFVGALRTTRSNWVRLAGSYLESWHLGG